MTAHFHPSRDYYLAVCLSFSLVMFLSLIVSGSMLRSDNFGAVFRCDPTKKYDSCSWEIKTIRFEKLFQIDETYLGMLWLMLHPIYGFCIFGWLIFAKLF
jgi:hypothetical protein